MRLQHQKKKARESITTEEALEGYYIVTSIVREVVGADRVIIRDRLDYCGILLNDNQCKQICRLWLNRAQKYHGLFDLDKKAQRMPIETLDDIYRQADRLKATVALYD